ncbi:MAG: phosphate signaling complex protein PhoU [Halothiobacillaceae bacterium]
MTSPFHLSNRRPVFDMEQLSSHTISRYDEDLAKLRTMMLKMGGIAEQHVQDALAFLLEGNVDRGENALRDQDINMMEVSIDEMAITAIARYQPTANDLRMIVTIIKAITDIERIGDKAEKIAKLAPEVAPILAEGHFNGHFNVMARTVKQMLHDTLDAFARMDAAAAEEIIRRDAHVNEEYDTVHKVLIRYMADRPHSAEQSLKILGCMRAMERIGDHCTNIAEHVVFQVQGRDVRHERPGDDSDQT